MTIAQFPHCDQRILHAPGECEHCDGHAEWQELRKAWGIAFTGHIPKARQLQCGTVFRDMGRVTTCRQAKGHPEIGLLYDGHSTATEWETQPCPADAARPPGSRADHRRWGGNRPTSATGDPSWPVETAASRAMYGDKGGREPVSLGHRLRVVIRHMAGR